MKEKGKGYFCAINQKKQIMAVSPIGAAVGALGTIGGLVSSYYGYKRAKEEAAKQDQLLAADKARLNDYYNRNYYGDYFSSAEAQNAMRRVEDSLRRRGQEAAGRAAINGGTAEAQLAQQENDQRALAETASSLAEQGTAIKRDADKAYLAGQDALSAREAAMSQQRQQGYAQLGASGAEVAKSGLLGVANSLGDIFDRAGKAGKTSAAAPSGTVTTPAPTGYNANKDGAALSGLLGDANTLIYDPNSHYQIKPKN